MKITTGKLILELNEVLVMVEELAKMLKEDRDYLIESLNAVVDDARPRYERQRKGVKNDIENLDSLVTRAEALLALDKWSEPERLTLWMMENLGKKK